MKPGLDDIRRILGDLDDHTLAEVAASGVTLAELEEIAAHLARGTDLAGTEGRPLTARTRALYALLRAQEARWSEDR